MHTASGSKIGKMTRRRLKFEADKVVAETAKVKHFGDAGSFKFNGCPTRSEPIFESRAVYLFLLIFLLPTLLLAAPSSLKALYATLDPTSVAQHFSFYELYPNSTEGKEALRHAWALLSQGESEANPDLRFPTLDIAPLLSLVNRSNEDLPLLQETQLEAIDRLGQHLGNRKLQGHALWNLEAILSLPPEEIDLARGLLIAELGGEEKEKITSYEASLDLMALQILARLPPHPTRTEEIRAINDYIFSEMGFRFPPHSLHAKDIDVYTFLPSVLDSRRGVCLGVSILYLSLAQRLNLPLEAITPPGHIFVRHVDATHGEITNIETTARGLDIPTELYLGIETKTLQKRNIKEVIGLAFMNQAAVSWHRGETKIAVSLYEKGRLFLEDDFLLQLFLGFNYLLDGREEEGRDLLKKIRGKAPEHVAMSDTIAEDYLAGLTDVDGIDAVFSEVDETRESIVRKQKRLLSVIERCPKFRQGVFHLAVTWLQLGREKEALPLLERFALLDPQNATARYYLAAICLQRHHFNQAWTHTTVLEALLKKE
ncbi:MAG TPA: transglutaminase family protein, partial [Chlamydiales bacterium]|nr:transglutaminase family protein [Chlamydiales bacterium]